MRARLLVLALVAGCTDRAPPPGGAPPPPADGVIPLTPAWRVRDAVAPRGFRAFGWAGDTLWGIARGRLAYLTLGGDTARLQPVAWGVFTAAAGDVAWTDDAGLHVRRAGGVTMAVPTGALGEELLGPEVVWSADGAQALLFWTDEAGGALSLLDGAGHRRLRASLPAHHLHPPAIWLDHQRVALTATSWSSRSGRTEFREGGFRAGIAVLDVARDTVRLIADADDGEFLVLAGRLAADSLLLGVRGTRGLADRFDALDLRTGQRRPRLDMSGRAAPALPTPAQNAAIAVLRPRDSAGAEPAWDLVLVTADAARELARLTAFDVRLLWHPHRRLLAVAQESESAGYRTLIVE